MGRTDGAATASYNVGRGTFALGIFYFFKLQSKPVFYFNFFSELRGLSNRRGPCAKEFRHLGWAPLFYHNPVSQVGTYSRSAGQRQVCVQAWLQVCGSSGSTVITPAFITPPNTPCGCSDVLSHTLFITPPRLSHPQTHLVGVWTSYHTPWFITPSLGPLRAALYHPRYTRYHTPHRIPRAVIIFLNPKMSSPGCVILCQSRYSDFWYTRYSVPLCFSRVFLSSRVTGACPVTTDLIMRVNVRTTTTTTFGIDIGVR